jgi:ankyrin repeat protein
VRVAGQTRAEQIAEAEGLVQDWPTSKASYKPDLNAKARDGTTALVHALTQGNVAVVKSLLDDGAAPNITDNTGWTALIFAAVKGHAEIVEALLAKGADPTLKAASGATALTLAQGQGHAAIVRLLQAATAP